MLEQTQNIQYTWFDYTTREMNLCFSYICFFVWLIDFDNAQKKFLDGKLRNS